MGRHSIIEKLNKEIVKGVSTEAQVVYILTEVRKVILEHDKSSRYFILPFFCDWVVHARMDRKGAQLILSDIDDFYRGLNSYLHIIRGLHFFGFSIFIVLKHEMKLFLKANSLPLDLVDHLEQWKNFLYLLIEVLIDCPLQGGKGYIRKFKFVKCNPPAKIACEFIMNGAKEVKVATDESEFIQ